MRALVARPYETHCPVCEGEGHQLALMGQVNEHAVMCVACGGEGRLEVCEGCGEGLEVVASLEVCGCIIAAELAA